MIESKVVLWYIIVVVFRLSYLKVVYFNYIVAVNEKKSEVKFQAYEKVLK